VNHNQHQKKVTAEGSMGSKSNKTAYEIISNHPKRKQNQNKSKKENASGYHK